MKTWKRGLASLLLWIAPFFSIAQCVSPLSAVTFDSTITGFGNSYHTFTFPKFDATLGTLVEVRIRAEVTLRYWFQLENRENVAINNYRVRVVRDDEISGSVLQSPIASTYQTTYGPYALAANDGNAGSGADYVTAGPVYVMNHQAVQQTVYNTADFLGPGNVSLDYAASTYSIVFGSVNYNFNGTAQDSVRFTVTYMYCDTWFLPADISSFTALKGSEGKINLKWITQNEKSNRQYTVEKSSDGRNFHAVGKLKANSGNYQYDYIPAANETGKLIFRLKQTEIDGTAKYSALRVVEVAKKKQEGIRIYPNPSAGNFNLLFSNTTRADWQVSIVNMHGLVLKQYEFKRALMARIEAGKDLSAGTYFIKAINKKTGEQLTQPLIIR